MSHYRFFALACLYLIFLSLGTAGPALAIPGICLDRTPAPPDAALNDGTDSVVFNFNVEHDTTCSSFKFEIIDPDGLVIPASVAVLPCTATTRTWPVPLGAQAGCYYGRVSFFSNWCSGLPGKFEDQATVGFLVKACVPVTVCKFEDVLGNHVYDPATDPLLPGWVFTFESPDGTVIRTVTTTANGCVTECIPVEAEGTTYWIHEVVKPGWVQTYPATNPFQVTLTPGMPAPTYRFGNWRPITITGFKYLDQAPWPWTSPHYIGPAPDFQQNLPVWEPVPTCPGPNPPTDCFNATQLQPYPTPIMGVVVNLYSAAHTLLATDTTDAFGEFSFGPINFQQQYIIEEENPLPDPPECDTNPEEGGLLPWPGEYVSTVAQSVWPSFCLPAPCPDQDFDNPDRLCITLPAPTIVSPEYGCNYFFNRQPSRLWGLICADTLELQPGILPSSTIVAQKIVDLVANSWPEGNPSWDPDTGFYQLDPIAQEPEGIRQGVYRLTPPAPSDPSKYKWQVTLFCNEFCLSAPLTFELPASGFIDVVVPPGCDIRVDFCLKEKKNETRCYLPVTFTQQGWHNYCDPLSTDIPGGMIYNKFTKVFGNKLIVGRAKTITYEGTTSGLNRLCLFLPQAGAGGKLDTSYLNPWSSTPAGVLAGETVALWMNIGYNDKRLMPRTPGYDLENFVLRTGLFKGKTVGAVMGIANRVLSGEPPHAFALEDYSDLVTILQAINANYEFVDMKTFNDKGYLIPNRAFGPPDPPHDPTPP